MAIQVDKTCSKFSVKLQVTLLSLSKCYLPQVTLTFRKQIRKRHSCTKFVGIHGQSARICFPRLSMDLLFGKYLYNKILTCKIGIHGHPMDFAPKIFSRENKPFYNFFKL